MSEVGRNISFGVLGSVRAQAGQNQVVTTGNERVFLAMLLLHANELVDRERLIDAIWDEQPPRNARNQLHGCVSRLRKRLASAGIPGRAIVTDAAGYEIRLDVEQLDLLQFRQQVGEARAAAEQGLHAVAVAGYRNALAGWRGPAMAGIDSPALRRAAAALEEEHVRVVEEHIDLELALGAAGELVARLTDLVAQHPYRERLHGALMLALHRDGRQADALASYQRFRRMLVDEVGAEPGLALRELHQRILKEDHTLLTIMAPRPTEGIQRGARHCLPRAVGDFTGRPAAVAQLIEAADESSCTPTVLAIDGMPGIGKTALAIHVAQLLSDRYPDGQLFVDLQGHSEQRPMESAAALDTLLRQLGVPGGRIPPRLEDRVALWRSELAERQAMVLLDNAASTAQVAPLVPAGPGCLVLVTSRRRLAGLEAVRPLSLDVLTNDEAILLLMRIAGERIRDEPVAAAEVARRCGNLPLAIRLAATRLAHRSSWRVEDLADRLRDVRGLLTELAAEDKSVADAFALSYDQLTPGNQRVFRLLGLHPGEAFDAFVVAATANSVVDESRRALDALVDWHLIEEPRPGRYRFHDLVRVYARHLALTTETEAERLAAVEQVLDLYLHATARTSVSLEGPSSRRNFRLNEPRRPDLVVGPAAQGTGWLEVERPNVVALVRHATELGLDEYAWRLARASWRLFYVRGYLDDLLEVQRLGLDAAERCGHDGVVATLANYLASAYFRTGDFGRATDNLERALVLWKKLGNTREIASVHQNLASTYLQLGQLDKAIQLNQLALVARQRMQETYEIGIVLGNQGTVFMALGRYREAIRFHRRHLTIARASHDLSELSRALGNLGAVHVRLRQCEAAAPLLIASLRLKRRIGTRDGKAEVLNELGKVQRELRPQDGLERHYEALRLLRSGGEGPTECMVRNDLGWTLREAGSVTAALEQHQAVLAEATRIRLKYEQARALDGIAACLAPSDPAEASRYWERALVLYREMGVPEQAEVERQLAVLGAAENARSEE